MKKLNSYHYFLCKYFLCSGMLFGMLSFFLRSNVDLLFISLVFMLAGLFLFFRNVFAWKKNAQIKKGGILIHPQSCEVKKITIPHVNFRGVHMFVLKCEYKDAQDNVHIVESDQIILAKWYSVDKIRASMVFIYVDEANPKSYVVEAFICNK